MDPRDVLAQDHQDSLGLLRRLGVDKTKGILQRAQRDLERRLDQAVRGPGADSFTAVQMRTALAQVRQAVAHVQRGVRDVVLEGAGVASEHSAENLRRYLESANKMFAGVARPLGLDLAAMVDAGTSGARASVLRRLSSAGTPAEGADAEPHPAGPGILDRYGMATVGHFEEILQRSLVSRAPWGEVKEQLTEASPFLQGAPKFWAERIARTELHGVYNRAGWESIREADQQLGDMVKILSATFDDRTAADSYAVHGQIRRPEEAFQSWFGLYQHPPNRPNDREVVVPHRLSWPIPPYLAQKTDEQVQARWIYDGRKGRCPPRPKMTTVPLGQFGKEPEKTAPPAPPQEPAEIPAERFVFRPAPPVPQIKRNDFAPPDLGEMRARVEKLAKKDAKLFPEKWEGNLLDDPSAALEVAARKRMKKAKTGDDRKYNVELPFEWKVDETNVDSPLWKAGFDGSRKKMATHSKPERIDIDDVVARAPTTFGGSTHANRSAMEANIAELVRNRGVYPDAGKPNEHDFMQSSAEGKPLLVRYGSKLYPYNPYELERLGAARLLGMKSLDVHVVDLNPHLEQVAREENAAIDERMELRERLVSREAARAKSAVENRVRKEHEGDPDVVAVRAYHQPAEYEKEYLAKYGEAAASIGWGRAMMERGLDLPPAHLLKLADRFGPDHPLHNLSSLVQNKLRDAETHATLREVLYDKDIGERTRAALKKAAAVFGHVDAIQPHESIHLGTLDPKVGDRDALQGKMDMLAALTDRSVTIPSNVVVRHADDGRANCQVLGVRTWKGNEVNLELKPDEKAKTVFHELGHAIEATDRGRGVRASAFLDARTAGDEAVQMRKLPGGHDGYREDEVARPDDFSDSYVGIDYGREVGTRGDEFSDEYFGKKDERNGVAETAKVHRGTEVTSMAVQELGNDSGAWVHFETDPEHFLFGLGQLGGY
jgi:hypothetical protein